MQALQQRNACTQVISTSTVVFNPAWVSSIRLISISKLYSYYAKLTKLVQEENFESVIECLQDASLRDIFKAYEDSIPNHTFKFWWSYLELVSMFTRAERDGIWELYLYSFRCMLPFFHRYDHTNYARWGTVYLADANLR